MNRFDSIQYMNVYSRRYDSPYEKVGECMKDFFVLFSKGGLKKDGDLFYTLNQINEKGDVSIELFLAAKEKVSRHPFGLRYRSYYVVKNMISILVRDEFEKNTECAYAFLMDYAKENGMHILSPFYQEVKHTSNIRQCIVKVVVDKSRSI